MDGYDFIECQICNNYEICLISQSTGIDSGLMLCEKEEHYFCKNCCPDIWDKLLNGESASSSCEEMVAKEHCPFCSKNKATDEEMLKYLLKKLGKTRSQIVKEMAK